MSSYAAPKNADKPSGNPYPKRGQIKVKIISGLVAVIMSAGRRREGDAKNHETGVLASAAGAGNGHSGYAVLAARDV